VAAHDAADVRLGVGQRQQEHLAGHELVAALAAFLLGLLQQVHQVAAGGHLAAALHLRQAGDQALHRGPQGGGVGARPVEQGLRTVRLRQHGLQHVGGFHIGVVACHGGALAVGQGLLERGRQLVESHLENPS